MPCPTLAHPRLKAVVAGFDGTLKVDVELTAYELFPFLNPVKRSPVAFPLERPVLGHGVGRRLPSAGDDPAPVFPVPDTRKLRQFRSSCIKVKDEDSPIQQRRKINAILVLLLVHPAQQCGDGPPDERNVCVLGGRKPGKDVIALLRRCMIGDGHRNRAVYVHLRMSVRALEERPEPICRVAFGKFVADGLFDAAIELFLELALTKRHRV